MRALHVLLGLAALALVMVLIVAIANSGLVVPQRLCTEACDCQKTGNLLLVPVRREVGASTLDVRVARIAP